MHRRDFCKLLAIAARALEWSHLYVNTTGEQKKIAIDGNKHGILTNRIYEGAVVLGPPESRSCDLLLIGWRVPMEHALYGGRRDVVFFGDLADALAALTIMLDGCTIQHQGSSADSLAVETGASHSRTHPFDDQRALQLRDCSDDDDNCPAQRPARVDVFSE